MGSVVHLDILMNINALHSASHYPALVTPSSLFSFFLIQTHLFFLISCTLRLDLVLKYFAGSIYFELIEALHNQILEENNLCPQTHTAPLHVHTGF